MEKEEKSTLGGFEAILDNFIPNKDGGLRDPLHVDEPVDDDELDDIKNSVDPVAQKVKKATTEEPVEEPVEEIEPVEEPKRPVGRPKSQQTVEQEEDEANNVSAFFDAFAEKLGWEFDEDEDRPQTVEEMIDYFKDVVEENSTPDYANDEMAALDEFVKQGGDIRDYFYIDKALNLDTIDLDDKNNQKLVVQNLLSAKGFSQKQIDKKISKYEESGILADEAEDAIDDLREIKHQQKEQLLAQQKELYAQQVEQQRRFYNTVVDEIKGLQNIRGIAIPEKDKRVLIDYILKPEADGRTRYQKDYASGGVKNLIESAYFTMNADKLLEAAKRQGNNSAVDRFKRSLRSTSINSRSKQQSQSSNDDPIWLSAARQLRIS